MRLFSYDLVIETKDRLWNGEGRCSEWRRKEEERNQEEIDLNNIPSKDLPPSPSSREESMHCSPKVSLPTFTLILCIQKEM